MKNFFKPEDFGNDHVLNIQIRHNTISIQDAAKTANEILSKLIESCPVVYLNDYRSVYAGIRFISTELTNTNTHQARLAFIEEIKKEECKHYPTEHWTGDYASELRPVVKCKHCGVELQATWSEKK